MDILPVFPPELLPFMLAALLIELTPGPNMTWLAMISAAEGRRAGFAAVGGVALGLGLLGIAGAMGAAGLIQSSAVLYEILRWAGVLFLLYLAVESWFAAGGSEGAGEKSYRGYFLRGLLTNLFNPKAALFYISVLPAFVAPQSAVLPQTLGLTAAYVLVATAVHAAIVTAAGTLEPLLNDRRRESIVRRVLSVLLALVAIWFALTTAR
ncbi:LysE family translocator [Pararhizobium sp.]|uniref:LysE family translocator n=1 Tax=Pararhizobium sp. TaxID=1977563 RepID=UPI0027229F02|nr:LysE family translocator [Pararhizobium sp.]MDO9417335.1 LysE family translocator [Pararhizobium sp.]